MVHVHVTSNPTLLWVKQQIREATGWDSCPRFLGSHPWITAHLPPVPQRPEGPHEPAARAAPTGDAC
jgi:hypothetical protein